MMGQDTYREKGMAHEIRDTGLKEQGRRTSDGQKPRWERF
jgi:hypothetical protein